MVNNARIVKNGEASAPVRLPVFRCDCLLLFARRTAIGLERSSKLRWTEMNNISRDMERYYPLPESQGGWRWLTGAEAIREQAGMDLAKLDQAIQTQEWLYGGDSW